MKALFDAYYPNGSYVEGYVTFEEVDEKLKGIMAGIFAQCAAAAKEYGDKPTNYVIGANIAGFLKIAEAMMAQGLV